MIWKKFSNLERCYMESLMDQRLTWQDFQLDMRTGNVKIKLVMTHEQCDLYAAEHFEKLLVIILGIII